MLKNMSHIIKYLAVLLVVYGVAKISLGAKGIWFAITYTYYSSSITFVSILYAVGIPLFFNFLIPVATIAGGVGLYQKKKWGWILSIIVSLTIFTIHCAGTVNFIIVSYFYRNIPMPPIPEGAHVEYVSMIPTYIITVISLTYILVLNRKSVKNEFIKSNRNA
jgi:hypothetical protein